MNDTPHDDGPKVAKLFADLDARAGHREVIPEGVDMLAKAREAREAKRQAAVTSCPDCGVAEGALHGDGCAMSSDHDSRCATGADEGCTCGAALSGGAQCPGCDADFGHNPDCEVSLAINGDPLPAAEEEDEPTHNLVQSVGKAMHQAGEAAIVILANMAEAEFAMGNPRNMPEPILGWYALTLAYQLCLFEFTGRPLEERTAHAGQLKAAIGALGGSTDYARGVQDEVAEVMTNRLEVARKLLGAEADLGYGGRLAWT